MRRKYMWWTLLPAVLLACSLGLVGCKGDDGDDGAAGADGAPGADGQSAFEVAQDNGFTGTEEEFVLAQADVGPEICSFCHNGEVARNGATHQELYDELFQQGVVEVSNVMYTYDGIAGNDVVTFNMTKDGADFDCRDADSLNIRFAEYDSATRRFSSIDTNGDTAIDLLSIKGTVAYDALTNTCTSTNPESALGDLNLVNGVLAVYGEDEILETIAAAHINLGRFPFAALLETGPAGVDYVSAANVTGCENCHTTPFYKHGYIQGDVSNGGGQDFWTCKVCHVDNRNGGHESWQISVNDPQRWAEIWNGDALTAAEKTQYAYKTRLMNDVHMSHSMEFPYPQPIRTCATCHAGKLTETLSDDNFVLETCLSCHPVDGGTDLDADPDPAVEDFAVDTRDRSLKGIWARFGAEGFHLDNNGDIKPSVMNCNSCHKDPNNGGIAPVFSALHTGYEPRIYSDTNGTHWRDVITASIDEVTLTGTVLDVKFSATGGPAGGLSFADVVPTFQVSFYGYDTKDFLVSNHTRDANDLRMEFTLGSDDNALFTTVTNDAANGSWEVMLDFGAYASDPTIADRIADGSVKKAEVIVRPRVNNADGDSIGLNAVSMTIDVTADGTKTAVDDYFKGDNALVKVTDGCNRCHDQLAVTFHSGDRGGNIVVCRSCHVVTEGGSHLEEQSRSIDSYVHAIHRFQAFDVDNIDFDDPVEKAKYEEHIEFLFPDFAAINCERCHTDSRDVDSVTMRRPYDIPDQSKSMPGVLSAADEIPGRTIAAPEVVVGPAARACGGCHRAQFIKEGDAGGLLAFNEHTKRFGYRVENDSNDSIRDAIISFIMGMFQ